MNSVHNTTALIFGGQGSQFTEMGKRIYDSFSEARSVFVLASDVIGYDVATMCFESSQKELNKTIYCQICTFTVEMAIYEVFKKKNIRLNAVAGFSLGEYSALVTHYTLQAKSCAKWGLCPLWKPRTTKQAVCCPLREHTAVCCQQPVSRSVFALCKVWRSTNNGISKR